MRYFDPNKIISKKQLNGNGSEFFRNVRDDLTNRIPKDVGKLLVAENSNPDYILLMHRTSGDVENIFNNGLQIRSGNDLAYTTSRYDNNLSFLVNINGASGYKTDGEKYHSVIMKIPKKDLEYVPGVSKPILMSLPDGAEQGGGTAVVAGGHQTLLLPEYILGSVEYKNGNITGFKNNENYRDVHDYKNDGLEFPSETIDDYQNKILTDSDANDISEDDISKIMSDENSYYETHKDTFANSLNEVKRNIFLANTRKKRSIDVIKQSVKKGMTVTKYNRFTRWIKSIFKHKDIDFKETEGQSNGER